MNWIIRSTCIVAVAAVSAVIGPVASAAPTQLTVVGAGKGAGAFRMAGGVAEVLNKTSKTVAGTNQESPGFVANTRMVASGRVELALTNGVLIDAIQRNQYPYQKDKKATNLRGIGPIAGAWLQIAVLADSDIKTLNDLKGKRVSLGPKGSNSAYMLTTVFKTLGIYDGMRKDYLKWADAATYMVDGKLDAFGIPNPIPSPSILQAAQSRPIHVFSLPDKVIDKFIEISKGYDRVTADVSVYQGMKGKKITTVHYSVFLITNDKVPADVVYEVAKRYYDPKNRDFIVSVFKPLRVGLDASMNDGFIKSMKSFHLKMHPGAVRYWKERGYKVD